VESTALSRAKISGSAVSDDVFRPMLWRYSRATGELFCYAPSPNTLGPRQAAKAWPKTGECEEYGPAGSTRCRPASHPLLWLEPTRDRPVHFRAVLANDVGGLYRRY
jgi:hypothetical protein